MQPRPIASRTMAPHHLPPLQELLGHGHVAARLLLRPQAHCLPSLDVLEYLGLLHQNNKQPILTFTCGWSQQAPQ